jgi:hypothetical protein
MKLAVCGKEIFASLLQQFGEGIVVSLIRQLNRIYFSLLKSEIMQEPLAQIHWYHSLLTIEELGKNESKLLGKIVWRSA